MQAQRFFVEHRFKEQIVVHLQNICNNSYPELFETATKSHENIYNVATGKVQPYDEAIEKAPQIYY
jgi:carbonic anhydrase